MDYSYLLVNFFTIIIPFIYSFHPKILFYRQWKAFFPSAFLVGSIFLIWDSFFTKWGVWGFNSDYLTGFEIINLPLEEILFFVCIPYSCVFTYFCLTKFYSFGWKKSHEKVFFIVFPIALLSIALVFISNLYTFSTFLSLGIVVIVLFFILKVEWLSNAISVYSLLLIPFLIVNGILTGTGIEEPIVWYNKNEIIGIRILTIPIEDVFYGLELFLLNILLFYYFRSKYNKELVKEFT